ncbi:MAG TPA: hypothetical protein VMW48_05555, partial [Vicinamibacterales bacterium]|nr:hypothetical protein [Vicinamibacterales bacterium]
MNDYEDDAPNVIRTPQPTYPEPTADIPDTAPNVMPSSWSSVAAGTAKAWQPALPPQHSSYQNAPSLGDALGAGLQHLTRPAGAAAEFLAGSTPTESLAGIRKGWMDPQMERFHDIGGVRLLPNKGVLSPSQLASLIPGLGDIASPFLPKEKTISARDIGSGVGEAVFDPTNFLPVVGNLPEVVRVSRAANRAVGGAMRRGGRAVAGAVPDIAAAGRMLAIDESGTIRLSAGDPSQPARIYSDPRDAVVARPRATLRSLEAHISNANDTFTDISKPGEDGWANGFIAVFGEKRPAAIKAANTREGAGAVDQLKPFVDERAQVVTPVTRLERFKAPKGGGSGGYMPPVDVELDVTYLRTAAGDLIPVETKNLDYFIRRFGDDLTYRWSGDPTKPVGIVKDGKVIGLVMPVPKLDAELADVVKAAAEFDAAGVSPAGPQNLESRRTAAAKKRDAAKRARDKGTMSEAQVTAESARRKAALREFSERTGTTGTYGPSGEIRGGERIADTQLIDRIGADTSAVRKYVIDGADDQLQRAAEDRVRRGGGSYSGNPEGRASRFQAEEAQKGILVSERNEYFAAKARKDGAAAPQVTKTAPAPKPPAAPRPPVDRSNLPDPLASSARAAKATPKVMAFPKDVIEASRVTLPEVDLGAVQRRGGQPGVGGPAAEHHQVIQAAQRELATMLRDRPGVTNPA